jgi:parvulin-like peptidyl-prolyl isomerase
VTAKSLRDKIKSGKMTFADAVAKYSDGPSRANGGDVGFFPRHDVVAEPFAEAAFKLEKDQISDPVATSFGVHLIQLTDVKPSEQEVKWQDVRQEIIKPAGEELYEQLARRERAKASVVFAGNWPYFDPVTREVVKPKTESEEESQ